LKGIYSKLIFVYLVKYLILLEKLINKNYNLGKAFNLDLVIDIYANKSISLRNIIE
jgi:hypothetical protein